MRVREHEPLAPRTTLRVGGTARFFVEVADVRELADAAAFARAHGLPLRVLGAGSNLLVPDEGVRAVVARLVPRAVLRTGDAIVADAGAPWEAVVRAAAARGLWGVENLAGIPGTVGGAVMQNIGAYGATLSDALAWVDAFDAHTGKTRRFAQSDCDFGYRASIFKKERSLVITRAAFALSCAPQPNLAYADLDRAHRAGEALETPAAIAALVRRIRREKFPNLSLEGTAGSFWKNPVVSAEHAGALAARYPGLPTFLQPDGSVKLSLGWLLDHALSLRGFSEGRVRLFEKQALVVVAARDATAGEIDAFTRAVAARVQETLGLRIEREVETFS